MFSIRVCVVMGPMEAAATPGNGKARPAAVAASLRWVTLEELVKVAASMPCWRALRPKPIRCC